jgi:hypothetical protein
MKIGFIGFGAVNNGLRIAAGKANRVEICSGSDIWIDRLDHLD